jgi:hypothetical protein
MKEQCKNTIVAVLAILVVVMIGLLINEHRNHNRRMESIQKESDLILLKKNIELINRNRTSDSIIDKLER